jgi:hypothetical protein
MPGGGGQTSTSKSEPWDGQKPYVLEGYQGAEDLYKKGPAQYYQGNTVAGFGNESNNAMNAIYQQGMNGAQQRAGSQYALDQFSNGGLGDFGTVTQMRNLGANNNFANDPAVSRLADMSFNGPGTAANLNNRLGDITGNGGNVAAYTRGAVGDITQTGGGSNSQIRNDTYDLITGAAQNANPAFASLKAAANGNFIGANPYLDDTYARAAGGLTRQFREGVAPGLDSAAASHGRYGSGMHANVKDAAGESFGRSLGDLANTIYGGAYNQERQNQLSAANSLGSLYAQGQGLRASTAAQSADQASRDAQLRLAATGQISGDMSGDIARQLQAAGMLQSAEASDASQKLAANAQLSNAYNQGADRQLQSLNSANAAYNASRAQQLQALGMQPAYQQMGYTDLNNASAVGANRDQMAQQMLNADIARWDFNQNKDWQNLSRFVSSINGGSPNATTSVTTPANPYGGLASLFAGLGGAGQLAMGTKGLLW